MEGLTCIYLCLMVKTLHRRPNTAMFLYIITANTLLQSEEPKTSPILQTARGDYQGRKAGQTMAYDQTLSQAL